jgi:flagellar biosynthesis/type III secretory pathway protein FliH
VIRKGSAGGYREFMIRQFKPVRFVALVGVAAFVVCGVAVFYSHRTAHGTTAEERAAYESGEKSGEEAPSGATLPTEAELNMMAQKYFEQQGSGEQLRNPSRAGALESCKQAFQKGYTAGFKKTHPQK